MSSANTEINNWYETLKTQALDRNDKNVSIWSKYKTDLETTKSLLSSLPKKVKHSVMVPIGPKALMPGEIVHTNEFLVNLGEAWFVKRTAHQTSEICDRRIKNCDEMLKKLAKERELIVNKSTLPAEQEAFGNEERPEIIEYCTEEEEQEWRKQHREKEKKYRQQLAELRNKEKKPIESEEDLWRHLDELELQEELEDDLNRLQAECSTEEEEGDLEDHDSEREPAEEIRAEEKPKRRVSFACDFDSSDDEPLRLEIKHSDVRPVSKDFKSTEINSPSDIYNSYLNLINKEPLSVLKHNANFYENNVDLSKLNISDDEDNVEEEAELIRNDLNISAGIRLNDITERKVLGDNSNMPYAAPVSKKVSKFKSSRVKS